MILTKKELDSILNNMRIVIPTELDSFKTNPFINIYGTLN
mgnify:CR=1 FL=1|jgi:hypothetical protein